MEGQLLSHIVAALETLAPLYLAEPWDNVGLLVGDRDQRVTRAMLTIDYTSDVAAEADAARCELVIAYHPPLFSAIKRVVAEGGTELIFDAIRRGIAIYSPHTALDASDGGTNDALADLVALKDRRPLRPRENPTLGSGRIGGLPAEISLEMLANLLKRGLGLQHLIIAGDPERVVKSVAICAGAGGELVPDALAKRADVYITGELRHHDAVAAVRGEMAVICTLHTNSERLVLPALASRLRREVGAVEFIVSRADRDPFVIL